MSCWGGPTPPKGHWSQAETAGSVPAPTCSAFPQGRTLHARCCLPARSMISLIPSAGRVGAAVVPHPTSKACDLPRSHLALIIYPPPSASWNAPRAPKPVCPRTDGDSPGQGSDQGAEDSPQLAGTAGKGTAGKGTAQARWHQRMQRQGLGPAWSGPLGGQASRALGGGRALRDGWLRPSLTVSLELWHLSTKQEVPAAPAAPGQASWHFWEPPPHTLTGQECAGAPAQACLAPVPQWAQPDMPLPWPGTAGDASFPGEVPRASLDTWPGGRLLGNHSVQGLGSGKGGNRKTGTR